MKVLLKSRTGSSNIVNMDKNAYISPHFRLFELANNDGDKTIQQMILSAEVDRFLTLLEQFRVQYNQPMNCNSCYRQPAYNKKVKGAANSLHLEALAFDWPVQLDYNGRLYVYDLWRTITEKAGAVGGINYYPWGCHLDANENKYGHTSFIIRRGSNTIVNSVPRYL